MTSKRIRGSMLAAATAIGAAAFAVVALGVIVVCRRQAAVFPLSRAATGKRSLRMKRPSE